MYTQQQVRTFWLLHLQTGCWYLECKANFCPSEEEEEKVRCGGELPTQDLDAEATASGKEATAITVASGKGKRQRNSVGVEDSGSKPKKSRAKKDSSDVPHVSSATVNPPFQSSHVRADPPLLRTLLLPLCGRWCWMIVFSDSWRSSWKSMLFQQLIRRWSNSFLRWVSANSYIAWCFK